MHASTLFGPATSAVWLSTQFRLQSFTPEVGVVVVIHLARIQHFVKALGQCNGFDFAAASSEKMNVNSQPIIDIQHDYRRVLNSALCGDPLKGRVPL